MSSTTLAATPSAHSVVSRRPAPCVREVRVCGCGQDLDTCHAGHCPRCGVTLHL